MKDGSSGLLGMLPNGRSGGRGSSGDDDEVEVVMMAKLGGNPSSLKRHQPPLLGRRMT